MPRGDRPSRIGRPPASSDAAARRLHIECARLYYASRWPMRKVAGTFRISRATAYAWVARVLGYDDPESLEIQAVAARSHRKLRPPSPDA